MAGEQGFLYEDKIIRKLKKVGVVPQGFHPAQSSNILPDAIFIRGKREYKLELKQNITADFGQGALTYNIKAKRWELAGADNEAAEEMRKLSRLVGVERIANKEWSDATPPMKFRIDPEDFKQSHQDYDRKNFPDKYIDLPSNAVAKYYNSKDTYYIQIQEYGFYYMGTDTAMLRVPPFTPKLKLRLRRKTGGSFPLYNYRFTTAIQASDLRRSTFDLDKDPSFLLK